jgi:hypothetical protein
MEQRLEPIKKKKKLARFDVLTQFGSYLVFYMTTVSYGCIIDASCIISLENSNISLKS